MAHRESTEAVDPKELNEEHRRLAEKHRKCEDRLAELRGKLLLSEDEKVEEINLKKQKLHLKDRMEVISQGLKAIGTSKSG